MARLSGELLPCTKARLPQFDSSLPVGQADLRTSTRPLRLAMNAARRVPRAQGIWGVSFWADLITDVTKRVFFMVGRPLLDHSGLMPG